MLVHIAFLIPMTFFSSLGISFVLSQMVYSNWVLLCDKMDETLQPATKTKRRSLIFIIILLFFVVVLVLIGFVSTNYDSPAFMICYLTAFVALIVERYLYFAEYHSYKEELRKRYNIPMQRKSILALDLKWREINISTLTSSCWILQVCQIIYHQKKQ